MTTPSPGLHQNNTSSASTTTTTTTTSLRPRARRRPSPLPPTHPHRTQSSAALSPSPPTSTAQGTSGLWSEVTQQWTTLQTLASSALGTDFAPPPETTRRDPKPHGNSTWLSGLLSTPPPTNKPSPSRSRRHPPAPPPPRKKRLDTSPSPPTTPAHEDTSETLVYIHPVTANVTLEGVVIAFDTTATSIRRANRLWPGDAVQVRKELLIPVDACRVKGTPLPLQPPEEAPASPEEKEEREYRPVGRTELPNIGPTVIAKLSRRKLSHFPPRRRSVAAATTSTPTDTVDLLVGGALREDTSPRSPRVLSMGPGVHSFHPENESAGLEWGEIVRGVEMVGGKVEGWVRRFGEGLGAAKVGGDLIEMVSGLGGVVADGEAGRARADSGSSRGGVSSAAAARGGSGRVRRPRAGSHTAARPPTRGSERDKDV